MCLQPDEFDYFAAALVERNGLVVDTAVMGERIRNCQDITYQQAAQIRVMGQQHAVKDSLTTEQREVILSLTKTNAKQVKKLRRRGKVIFVLSVSAVLLGTIVLLK